MIRTLCSDVDSTVWDTGARVREAVLEVTGETLDVRSVSTWTAVLEAYGEEATTRVFDRVFSPEGVRDRVPYPGSGEALRFLQEERGIAVHFVTRGHDPEAMRAHLLPRLEKHCGRDVGLTFAAGDKLEVLERVGAFGMVDDRPETLGRVADAGLWAATKVQPWNEGFVAGREDVHGFRHWRELPRLLPGRI